MAKCLVGTQRKCGTNASPESVARRRPRDTRHDHRRRDDARVCSGGIARRCLPGHSLDRKGQGIRETADQWSACLARFRLCARTCGPENTGGRFCSRGRRTGSGAIGDQTRFENYGPVIRSLPGPESGQRASPHLTRPAKARGDVSSCFHPRAAQCVTTAWLLAHPSEPGESAARSKVQVRSARS